MKQLVCEMCGGTDLIKQEGVFVCQTCGCKYSVEDAKKLMVDGVVEVTGTVEVDRKSEVENRLKNAIQEYKNGNHSRALNFTLEILNLEPENAKAILYKGLSEGWNSTVKRPLFTQSIKEVKRAVEYAKEQKDSSLELSEFCKEAMEQTMILCGSGFLMCKKYREEQLEKLCAKMDQLPSRIKELERQVSRDVVSIDYAQRENARLLEEGKNIIKESEQVETEYESTRAHIANRLNELFEFVFSCFGNETVCEGFYDEMERQLGAYEGQIPRGDVKQAHAVLVYECKKRKKEDEENRVRLFWEEHPEEKRDLEEQLKKMEELPELKKVEQNIEKINQEIGQIQKENNMETLEKELKAPSSLSEKITESERQLEILRGVYSKLGFFKIKEKKNIEEQIKENETMLYSLTSQSDKEIEERNEKIHQELAEIQKLYAPQEKKLKELKEKKKKINEKTAKRKKEIEEMLKKGNLDKYSQ